MVAGRPFLEILIHEVASRGFTRFLLLASFEAQQIQAFARDLPKRLGLNISVEVLVEPERAGTGGALHFARHSLESEFLLMNGDTLFDVPLLNLVLLLDRHPNADAVMALRVVAEPDRYDAVSCDGDLVVGFGQCLDLDLSAINGGIYAMRRRIVDWCPTKGSLERDVFPVAASRGVLRAVKFESFFLDIGVPDDYIRAQIEIPRRRLRPAAFLDRKCVVSINYNDVEGIPKYKWKSGAREAIVAINQAGYRCFIVSNQDDGDTELWTEADYLAISNEIRDDLARSAAWVDDEFHHIRNSQNALLPIDEGAKTREQAPEMFADFLLRWPTDISRSWMITESNTEIADVQLAGIICYLFNGNQLNYFIRPFLK